MCLLIVLVGVEDDYPIVVGSNRDEHRERKAAPPGLFVGERRRILSPRDGRAGGTWIGVNDRGLFACLTNVAGTRAQADAPSRGRLPHTALDRDDLDAAVDAVERAVSPADNAFQLVLTDGARSAVVVHVDGAVTVARPRERALVVSNEHRLGELELPDLEAALAPGLGVEQRLDALRGILLDTGERSGHRVLKRGGGYGTVSSSLIAVHEDDPRRLVWRYAPGPPDETEYRSYGNLGRRLVEE